MRESMPDTHGWVDRGPADTTHLRAGYAGPVRRITVDGEVRVTAPYSLEHVEEIVRKGREEPRRLSLEESRLVGRNLEVAKGDAMALETWYRVNGPRNFVQGLSQHMASQEEAE